MLKNKEEINFFENLCRFKVAEVSDLISRLDFLLIICFFVLVIVLIHNLLVSPSVLIVQSICLIS